MNDRGDGSGRDLVIPPNSYAYVQSLQNGGIKTLVGPTMMTISGQDRAVAFNPDSREWVPCHAEQAIRQFVRAGEGDYIILENPTIKDDDNPQEGGTRNTPEGIRKGEKIVINGPATFALWPGQIAETRSGHHLLSNQFLRVRVYNESAARSNWKKAVTTVKEGESAGDPSETSEAKSVTEKSEAKAVTEIKSEALRLGQIIIIRGTEVSFYIPPTGIEVLKGPNGDYVQEAVTLERLEYCILVDENGNKRYERGPAVVFPKATERFVVDEKNNRKFKAIELNKISGLHIKVIQDYKEDGKEYKAGDELFITGETCPIYFPRAEHSIIKYGNRDRHYAVTVPAGEARYVLDRETGQINTECGPKMLLPDPTKRVLARRILSQKQCELWYPGNADALAYNQKLLDAMRSETKEGQGYLSEEAYSARYKTSLSSAGAALELSEIQPDFANVQKLARAGVARHGDEFERKSQFTPPRTLTLDTKFDGVPRIDVWTGYAVMVVNKSGNRRVVIGPASVLLDYDESLEVLELSTGKPKTTDQLKRTVYLRIKNNKVSDIIRDIETSDHVRVDIKISLLVNFKGEDPEKWFDAENYVKLLCDHVRSVLKGSVQKKTIEDLWANHVSIVRDSILGESIDGKRAGMVFEENGMAVKDVEVLGFDIQSQSIANRLQQAQFEVVANNIDLKAAERNLNTKLQKELFARQSAEAESITKRHMSDLSMAELQQDHELTKAAQQAEIEEANQKQDVKTAQEEAETVEHQFNLRRDLERANQEISIHQRKQQLQIEALQAEVDAVVKRFESAQGGFSEALTALNRDDVVVKIAEAWNVQRMIGGDSFVDAFNKAFKGTPLANFADSVGGILGHRVLSDQDD